MLIASLMPKAIKFKTFEWLEIRCLQRCSWFLNQELKECMPAKNPFDFQPQSFSSGSIQIEK